MKNLFLLLIFILGCNNNSNVGKPAPVSTTPNQSNSNNQSDHLNRGIPTPQNTLLPERIYSSKQEWIANALTLQEKLDHHVSLGRATFLGTHNSYNAKEYSNNYFDPNQIHTIYNQLKIGVRAIELDLHNVFRSILLCHALSNHLGCAVNSRTFEDGLNEILQWLDETKTNPEVLFVYLEDKLDSLQNVAAGLLWQKLGNYMYKPVGGSCQPLPFETTKAQILKSGKRVVVITDGCKNSFFHSLVFGGYGNAMLGYPTDSLSEFQNYPACVSNRFSKEIFDNLLVRFFEDRTEVGRILGGAQKLIDALVTKNLLNCGANLFGWDLLTLQDARLEASIWSWSLNKPSLNRELDACVKLNNRALMEDSDCQASFRFACRKPNSTDWTISSESGPWNQGQQICQKVGQAFEVPFSAQDNLRLQALRTISDSYIWVNYRRSARSDTWVVREQ